MGSSKGGSLTNMVVVVRLFLAVGAASTAYAAHALVTRVDMRSWARHLLTGPGRTSRGLVMLLVVMNLKSLPFAWTVRLIGAMIRQKLWPRPPLPPQSLFHYSITTSRTSLMETDYNFHKSNSTYFADLDMSRTHLCMYLLGAGMVAAENNQTTRLVCAPAGSSSSGNGSGNGKADGGAEDGADCDGKGTPMPGNFGVGLGAVFCSFRKEIAPYQPYELWSRILSWDRKWLYMVTHFVVKGKVKPASWDGRVDGRVPSRADQLTPWTAEDEAKLQKYVIATAISKYVFKIGRFTVHPTYLMEASDILPARPGEGWRGGGPEAVGNLADLDDSDDSNDDSNDDAAWTWKDVERERRRGMVYAQQFAALDGAGSLFDGGRNGALGIFGPA